eukprot:TRINITY_DN2593_c0_g2_i1.p1 TRINITY_DN2593_c0_g2~~TRINITY_DN2593_c0_g2_i1.p1  ORF type:complete len:138 (-),score=15.21 TRINITY_DN2593_c0_g2_i1:734-1147(-)
MFAFTTSKLLQIHGSVCDDYPSCTCPNALSFSCLKNIQGQAKSQTFSCCACAQPTSDFRTLRRHWRNGDFIDVLCARVMELGSVIRVPCAIFDQALTFIQTNWWPPNHNHSSQICQLAFVNPRKLFMHPQHICSLLK